ncbi:MAG TPA: PAS domain-containing protein [Candidatus Thermoplasmatota archaeon]|nr:PAS domain-containing protein [Candidatus Thermoplasmatota archaeon]
MSSPVSGQTLVASTPAEAAAVRLTRLVMGAASAFLIELDLQGARVLAATEQAPPFLPLAGLPATEAFHTPLQLVVVPDTQVEPRYRAHPLAAGSWGARTVAAIGIPGRAPTALLALSREPHGFTRAQLEAFQMVAEQMGASRVAQETARDLERRLENALALNVQSVARLGTWEWDFRTGQVTWSAELYRIYGVTPAEYTPTYEGYLQKVHPDDRAHVKTVTEQGFGSRKPYSHHARILRPDGTLRHLHTWTNPVLDDDGNVIRLIGVCQDVTERALAEEAARRATEQTVRIYESMTDAFFAVDRDWRFIYMNPIAHRMRATLTWEEQKGKRLWDIYPDLVGTKFWTEYHRAMETGQPVSFEERYPRMDRWFEVNAYPSAEGLSVYYRDVTARKRAELGQAESEARWQSLVESMPASIILVDREGIVQFQNRVRPETAHLSVVGKSVYDFVEPDQAVRLREAYVRAFEGKTTTFELPARRGNGATAWFRTSIGPVLQDGKVRHAIALSEDITERRQADEALRASEERLRTVVTGAPLVVWSVNPSGTFTLAEGKGLEVLGLSPRGLVGKSIFTVYAGHADLLADVKAALQGEARSSIITLGEVTFDSRMTPLRDDMGRVVGVIGVATDITERRRAEQRLLELTALTQEIFDNVPAGVVHLDAEGRMTRMNRYLREIVGFTTAEIPSHLRTPITDMPQVQGNPILAEGLKELSRGRPFYNLEFATPPGQGQYFVFNISAVPLLETPSNGDVPTMKGAILLVRDITARKQAEAELEASRKQLAMTEKLSALGTLVAGVAHEINNPLAFMKGTAQIIEETLTEALQTPGLPEAARETIRDALRNDEVILQGIERIAHITKSLKAVARASTGVFAPEDVNALAESVLTVASPRVPRALRVERDFRARALARGSGAEISQVLLNLVLNAVEAMGTQEGGKLTLRTYDDRDHVVVEVQDTGPGIRPEDEHRIFTPFFTTKAQGTGLGLSVSYRIVEDHGGKLTFTTEPGRGTTFRITLPKA